VFIMSVPVSMGTFATYGISALLSALSLSFKISFFVGGSAMLLVAFIWLVVLDTLKRKCAEEKELSDECVNQDTGANEKKKSGLPKGFIAIFSLLAVFAIVNNFVKDGVTTWMPKILIEKYDLGSAVSTFCTLFLPLFAVFGSFTALTVQKRTGNYIVSCGVFYLLSTVMIALVLLFLDLPLWIVTLACFSLVATFMSAVNNILTSIFPLTYSKSVNAGMVAGLIDGFCYVGSAITTFGLGAVRDVVGGWNAVFYLLFSICALMVVVCLIYLLIKKRKTEKTCKN
ncbi:MAG: MFS transporter, partial [Clostridia bacterium]|nr:MFS transporter [Clostridia bacterium]